MPYAELSTAVKQILGDTPLTIIYDAWAKGGSQQAAFSMLPSGGLLCTAQPAQVGERGKDDEQGRRVVCPYGSVHEEHHHAFGAEMYAHLTGMLEQGDLKVSPRRSQHIGTCAYTCWQPSNVKLLIGGFEAIPAGCDELLQGLVSGVKLVARVD